jgi:S-formylglutathione hydrolase FrmB
MIKKIASLTILVLLALRSIAAETDTITVSSPSMKKAIRNVIILPAGYKSQGNSFPVLYLLHGADGNYRDWIRNVPDLPAYSDLYHMIIVCPDGGRSSWYFDSPVDDSSRYETYIIKELIPFIDGHYNTIRDQHGRAITGLSMGGHGALYLSFRHTDLFGAAGSMSGGVDIRPFPKGWDLPKRLGEYAEHPDAWDRNTVINMTDSIKGKTFPLIFDCGVDDFFYTVNKNLHQKLLEAKIPHDFTERPGKHNWAYWKNAVKYQLLFFHDFFVTPRSYTSYVDPLIGSGGHGHG